MKDREFEDLSRFVDDDLSAVEKEAFEKLLSQRPDLQSALNDLVNNKEQIRHLAERDCPPEALDSLVRPLRRGGRPQLRQSILVPLAAAAAIVAVAIILGLEIGRHGPLPDPNDPQEKPTVFALKALPEADDSSLVGALEHLMAMPYPEPDMIEPEALFVIGPLPAPPEYYRQRLALDLGAVQMPLNSENYPIGLEVDLSVAEGRLVECRATGDGGDDALALCRALAGASLIGVGDGDHRATVIIAQ